MKKIFALAIALVMVLAIAAPAMAFTSVTVSDDETSPFELDLYLVEYDDNDFFGITTLPESDRGYAKNEIVAAVAELFVPEDEDPADADYGFTTLEFSGENVSLNVTDNDGDAAANNQLISTVGTTGYDTFTYNSTDDELTRAVALTNFGSTTKDMTYKWLVFAKVTDDEASLTFALRTAALAWGTVEAGADDYANALDLGDYVAVAVDPTSTVDGTYTIWEDNTAADTDVNLFTIFVDDDYETTGLAIHDGALDYTVIALANGTLGFIIPSGVGAGTLVDDDDLYDDLMEIYEEIFVEEFGFDFDLIGGVVDDDTFEAYVGSDDIEVTVDIAPWTAYVSVPDNIVVDPPKTGDAASILGFVMIVLAAAAVVAVRKVRA